MRSANSGALAAHTLAAWLGSPSGGRLLAAERAALRTAARRFYGDALLWIGASPQLLDTTAQCMVRTRVLATIDPNGAAACGQPAATVHTAAGALPFAAGAVDGVLLHHALEAAPDARAALREAARVLRVGGLLMVVGFNPLSPWLFAKPLPAFRALKTVSAPRLRDWLALLGLEAEGQPAYVHVPVWSLVRKGGGSAEDTQPQGSPRWWRRLPTGGVYVVSATKVAHGFIAPPLRRRQVDQFAGAVPHPVACVRPAA